MLISALAGSSARAGDANLSGATCRTPILHYCIHLQYTGRVSEPYVLPLSLREQKLSHSLRSS